MFPKHGQLKQSAKMTMGKSMPFWMKTIFFLVGVQVLLHFLRAQLGGLLGWYLIPISEFANAQTGYFAVEKGFEVVFRMDALQMVAAMSLTYAQIIQFLWVNAVALLLLAPIKMGALERFWLAFQGKTQDFPSMFRWYSKPSLLGKSVLVSLILDLGCRLLAILLMLPSSLIYFYLYGGSWMGTPAEASYVISLLAFLGMILLLGGAALAFYCYSSLYPIAYCLAAQPDYSFGKVVRRGLDSIKGQRGRFFRFRLSFLPWLILSSFSYGVMDLYILPYLSFASFHFLQEAAILRTKNGDDPRIEPA